MRPVRATALVVAALLATLSARPVQSQIGGFIKKKAVEAAKGKADKTDDAATAPADSCGPITPEKVQAFLRGLQAEGSARTEFDTRVARAESIRAESEPRIKACRDAENGGPTFVKIMTDGFTGTTAPSTGPAVQAQMDKNKVKLDEYLDKKCGKVAPPVSQDPGDTYRKAHAAGLAASGMSEYCYDVLGDRVIAFCKLPKDQQQAAADKGLRAEKTRQWLFTADEAKALQPRCNDLLAALKTAGSTLVP